MMSRGDELGSWRPEYKGDANIQHLGRKIVQCDPVHSFVPFEHFYSLKDEVIVYLLFIRV